VIARRFADWETGGARRRATSPEVINVSPRLPRRRIIVTGAANGIGRATAERFLREGGAVAAVDKDAHSLRSLEKDCKDPKLSIYDADLTDDLAVSAAIEAAARRLSGIDGVVNSAGIDLVAEFERMGLSDWNRILAVNLTGPVLVMRATYGHLRAAGGGTIVNVASGAGLSPLMHRTAYCASKAGLQMASKALALEAAPFRIRVNCVCPGAVDTALFRQGIDTAPDPAAMREQVKARYALRRIAEPQEIAAAILWLTSDESSYVTGTAMAVDGGRTFH
jgi:NAD(P)-dependent dehydrogenase (short-subunit alcohol dehydrogenase family)